MKDIKVRDDFDDNVEILYSWNSEFDINKAGEYVITFWAVDDSGNKSAEVTRTVVVGSEYEMTDYLIVGGIVFVVLLIVVVAIIVEVKKQKKLA